MERVINELAKYLAMTSSRRGFMRLLGKTVLGGAALVVSLSGSKNPGSHHAQQAPQSYTNSATDDSSGVRLIAPNQISINGSTDGVALSCCQAMRGCPSYKCPPGSSVTYAWFCCYIYSGNKTPYTACNDCYTPDNIYVCSYPIRTHLCCCPH